MQQTIYVGATSGDGTGTPLRTAFSYINQNFTELYTHIGILTGNSTVSPVYTTTQVDTMIANIMTIISGIDNGLLGDEIVDYGSIIDPPTIIEDYGSF